MGTETLGGSINPYEKEQLRKLDWAAFFLDDNKEIIHGVGITKLQIGNDTYGLTDTYKIAHQTFDVSPDASDSVWVGTTETPGIASVYLDPEDNLSLTDPDRINDIAGTLQTLFPLIPMRYAVVAMQEAIENGSMIVDPFEYYELLDGPGEQDDIFHQLEQSIQSTTTAAINRLIAHKKEVETQIRKAAKMLEGMGVIKLGLPETEGISLEYPVGMLTTEGAKWSDFIPTQHEPGNN